MTNIIFDFVSLTWLNEHAAKNLVQEIMPWLMTIFEKNHLVSKILGEQNFYQHNSIFVDIVNIIKIRAYGNEFMKYKKCHFLENNFTMISMWLVI